MSSAAVLSHTYKMQHCTYFTKNSSPVGVPVAEEKFNVPSGREHLLHWGINYWCRRQNQKLLHLYIYLYRETSHRHIQLFLCRVTSKILGFIKPSKIQLCLKTTMCKAHQLSFPYVKDVKLYSLPTQPQNPMLLFLCPLAALLSSLKGRISGVSCNLYENVMLSSSFIYVMQSQDSPLQNLKHTQWNLTGKGG